MHARLNFRDASPGAMKMLVDMREYLRDCGLSERLRLLVEIRISQINGCAYCVDLHVHQVRSAGETAQRLDCLCVWRDVTLFDARERAALAWAEALARVADTRAPDDVFAEVSAQFGDREIVDLSLAICAMNAWNRFGVGFRMQPPTRNEQDV
ncbi:MAG: carboxymuconolactone decarboxylase family protein [Rudaea sp.]